MKLHIKNMVCDRCILMVSSELEKLGIRPVSVQLGDVELTETPGPEKMKEIEAAFRNIGFEILQDPKTKTVEAIKQLIIQQIYHDGAPKINYSTLLSENLHRDYTNLSKLFSAEEGITIERYIILQKIERVKALLLYNTLSLSQIADEMGYSSVAHLSGQFKKVTGETVSQYKLHAQPKRNPIDKLTP